MFPRERCAVLGLLKLTADTEELAMLTTPDPDRFGLVLFKWTSCISLALVAVLLVYEEVRAVLHLLGFLK